MNKTIIYATGNVNKVAVATERLAPYDITLVQGKFDIDEIQSDSFEEIAIDKAKKAFALAGKPLFVNDSGWLIPALNGFPGPYMKYINQCFTPQDFLSLMANHEDKTIILRETIVYIDTDTIKVFSHDFNGTFVASPRGSSGPPSDMAISLSATKKTIAEEKELGITHSEEEAVIWNEFGLWLKNR